MFPGIFLVLKTQLGMGMGYTGDAGQPDGNLVHLGNRAASPAGKGFFPTNPPIASPRGW